ncbi:MAG: LysR family transcriptional regulator [Homoserinimonas sp.]|nr:LysR family transcriptional regulator [Homoserinimonas sp.]
MSEASAPFRIAFVPGVTITKWSRAWAERRPDRPLAFAPTAEHDQTAVLHEDLAEVSFVRLPINQDGLSVIRLYSEIPVVVAAKDHSIALSDSVTLADLAGETLRTEPLEDAIDIVAAGAGVLTVPHSLARLHARKDLISRPVTDAPETEIAVAWVTAATNADIEEFVGIVRGRSAASSRGQSAPEPVKSTARAKAKAREARQAAARTPATSRAKKPRGRR